VSSAKQWELGKCELLVKVYPGSLASSWLARACVAGARVRLSTPQKTLHVPALVP
jgi:ferredoxin-NADP reductase